MGDTGREQGVDSGGGKPVPEEDAAAERLASLLAAAAPPADAEARSLSAREEALRLMRSQEALLEERRARPRARPRGQGSRCRPSSSPRS